LTAVAVDRPVDRPRHDDRSQRSAAVKVRAFQWPYGVFASSPYSARCATSPSSAAAPLHGETLVGSFRALFGSDQYRACLGKLTLFAPLVVLARCSRLTPRQRG
jgi:hypothetical protein